MPKKEDDDMLAEIKKTSSRRPNRKRLFSYTTPERLEMINEKSKKNGGLSNLTYGRVYGKE